MEASHLGNSSGSTRELRERWMAWGIAFAILGSTPACDDTTRAAPRVVSLTPLGTRFVLALGAGDHLVAADGVSAEREGLVGLPTATLDEVPALAPDLLLVHAAPDPGSDEEAALARGGIGVVEFAPHDLEDAIALVREVGTALVGAERAGRFEAGFSRPLARIGGDSRGRPRPRVVAVVSADPLVIAGGHSFETDLIEIAGGRSVTHPGEEARLTIRADAWKALAPDLVLVVAESPPDERAERAWRNTLPRGAEIAFLTFDDSFWLEDPTGPALRLRAVIEPIADRMGSSEERAPGRDAPPPSGGPG